MHINCLYKWVRMAIFLMIYTMTCGIHFPSFCSLGLELRVLQWQHHNWYRFASYLTYITGAKFKWHHSNIPRDILDIFIFLLKPFVTSSIFKQNLDYLGNKRFSVQAPLKSWIFFRLLYAICKNCDHNCEDHSSFENLPFLLTCKHLSNKHIFFLFIYTLITNSINQSINQSMVTQ